jgi:8-oxo-dGTP pyrophosphatase MutT (NUDIX family)
MLERARSPKLGPSLTDLAIQAGYIAAYQLVRTYWRLRHPTTHGALVALWCRGEVLLLRHSYVPYYSAPGGYLQSNEDARHAALRELEEELSLALAPNQLSLALEVTHDWEGKQDHVVIFSAELAERPLLSLDYREVVEAFWFRPEQVRELDVFPPLKQAIARHA